ncbi:hypothetical protein [Flavobacterium sp.]|uniref:hypothetical protein n=1 Tax=Flavobacterium sp. TaxID=239 RepID=UPI0039E30A13
MKHYFPEATFTADGGLAYKKAGEILPDQIFINYADKPSHGRQTAAAILQRKSTASIPIYFVDGSAEENEKALHLGHCISKEEISKYQ